MVAHPRLGEGSVFEGMLDEILHSVVAAARVWPRGRAGEVEGVVRLLGGGLEPREQRHEPGKELDDALAKSRPYAWL